MLFVLFTVVAVIGSFLYQFIRNQRKKFEDVGIEYDNALPILGSFKDAMFGRENFFDITETVYKKFNSG